MFLGAGPLSPVFFFFFQYELGTYLIYVNSILSNYKSIFDMEDSKLEEILEKVISKTSKKFAKFEHSSLRNDIRYLVNLRSKLKKLNSKVGLST